jgi:hypothetical protein
MVRRALVADRGGPLSIDTAIVAEARWPSKVRRWKSNSCSGKTAIATPQVHYGAHVPCGHMYQIAHASITEPETMIAAGE